MHNSQANDTVELPAGTLEAGANRALSAPARVEVAGLSHPGRGEERPADRGQNQLDLRQEAYGRVRRARRQAPQAGWTPRGPEIDQNRLAGLEDFLLPIELVQQHRQLHMTDILLGEGVSEAPEPFGSSSLSPSALLMRSNNL